MTGNRTKRIRRREETHRERTLIIIKPDAIQRNLLGEVISRFERKGLKIVGAKMVRLSDVILNEHYAHHRDKLFFESLKSFMKSAPCVVMVLEGRRAVRAVRLIVGPTRGHEADAGSIRGDLSMGTATNIVHASDTLKTAHQEIRRFFSPDELFHYQKIDYDFIYGHDTG